LSCQLKLDLLSKARQKQKMDIESGHHAFISGGASGIGLGIADAHAGLGVRVTLADIDADALRAVLSTRGNAMRGVHLDVRNRANWQAAKAEAEAAFGPVDILVNNAGIGPNGSEIADMAPESWDRIIAINLTGIANGVFTFGADIRARGKGHIVNTASMAGLTADRATLGAYAAAKFGVMALSETLRAEMAPHGVGVSVLCPGLVNTNLGANTNKLGFEDNPASAAMPESPVTAAMVADCVIDAIANNRLYAISHPERFEQVGARHDAIRNAFASAADGNPS
jgi:NAD(P)-dependent dehydrogenase (short-subunit alcohol dehydrogenase family)